MDEKNITARLKLINGGRSYYLEFLRNLTPQVMLFTVSILCMKKLDIYRIDFSNFWPTLITFIFIGSFLLAFYANSTLFYENCFSDLRNWSKDINEQLSKQNVTGFSFFIAKSKAAWKEQRIEYFEVFTVLFFFQFALAAVIVMATYTAYGIVIATHTS